MSQQDMQNARESAQAVSKGKVYFLYGKNIEAIREFARAIKIRTQNSIAYFYRGLAYRKCNKYKEAISDYTKTIELDPAFAKPYHNMGYIYWAMGDFDAAINYYTKAIEVNPGYALAYYSRAIAYYQKHEQERALDENYVCNKEDCGSKKAWQDVCKAKELGHKIIDPWLIRDIKKELEWGIYPKSTKVPKENLKTKK